MADIPKTIFVGWQQGVVAYYRCYLPALVLGADYTAGVGEPPNIIFTESLTSGPVTVQDLFGYEVVVAQQPRGVGWLKLIRELQDAGVRVLYEVDDYIQGARKSQHEFAGQYDLDTVRGFELAMGVTDGIICSNEFLARRYRSFNQRTWICRNGLDLKRYEYPRTTREGVTIGWAGGVGHRANLRRWEPAIRSVLRQRPEARLLTVGYRYAEEYVEEFGPERARALPSAVIEVYPASMSLFDVAFAPSAEDNMARGKSDLRWLEASALRIPLVAHPDLYPEVEDGVTGMTARTAPEAEEALLRLIDDPELRERIGRQAHEYVAANRSITVLAEAWRDVLTEVVAAAA